MNKPVVLLAWFAVPLGAVGGYYGGRSQAPEIPYESKTTTTTPGPSVVTRPDTNSVVTGWTARLEKCGAAELPALFAEIGAVPDAAAKTTALRLLCARWAEVDVAGGVAFFTTVKEDTKDPSGRIYLLTEWALRDPSAAYEATLLPGKDVQDELTIVGTELLYDDAAKFWQWFQKARLPFPSGESEAWKPVIRAHFDELLDIAAETLAATGKDAGTHPGGWKAAGLYQMLAASMADKDAEKAVAWAAELPQSVRHQALLAALGVLAKRQPEKIFEHLVLLKDKPTGPDPFTGPDSENIIKSAATAMAARDPQAALEWVNANQGVFGNNSSVVHMAVADGFAAAMRDGKLTPEQAFTAVCGPNPKDASIPANVLRHMWGQLSAEQLAATAAWVKNADSKSARSHALSGILQAWKSKDLAGAVRFAEELREPAFVNEIYESIARHAQLGIVNTQGERVAAVIASIPAEHRAGVLYNQVRENYSEHMADHSPPFEGARFAAALEDVPASEAKDRAVTMVAGTWGASDPVAALEWAGQQADATMREKATGAAVGAWAKEDAWGASEWIKAQPPGESRDVAAHHLARELRSEEPESAWAWAADIGDAATRLEAQSAVLRKWRDASPGEARAAVEAIADSLPPEVRQQLMDTLEKSNGAK